MNKIALTGALLVIGAGAAWMFQDYRQKKKEEEELAKAKAVVEPLVEPIPEVVPPSR